MTRINLFSPLILTDQHLMAEYRELPMVMAAAARSNPSKVKISSEFVLGKGHVTFFYNKKAFLQERYNLLVKELEVRGFNVAPDARTPRWEALDKFDQLAEWAPTAPEVTLSFLRVQMRIAMKPNWYRYCGEPILNADGSLCWISSVSLGVAVSTR